MHDHPYLRVVHSLCRDMGRPHLSLRYLTKFLVIFYLENIPEAQTTPPALMSRDSKVAPTYVHSGEGLGTSLRFRLIRI